MVPGNNIPLLFLDLARSCCVSRGDPRAYIDCFWPAGLIRVSFGCGCESRNQALGLIHGATLGDFFFLCSLQCYCGYQFRLQLFGSTGNSCKSGVQFFPCRAIIICSQDFSLPLFFTWLLLLDFLRGGEALRYRCPLPTAHQREINSLTWRQTRPPGGGPQIHIAGPSWSIR